tara:strand:+ start:1147 stop:1428 length:282 start_codon:yes stop_codon:yes gene_type:complete
MPKPIEDMSIEELQITYGVSRPKAKQIHKVYCKYPTDATDGDSIVTLAMVSAGSDYQSEHGEDFFEMGDRIDLPDGCLENLPDEAEEEWWMVI